MLNKEKDLVIDFLVKYKYLRKLESQLYTIALSCSIKNCQVEYRLTSPCDYEKVFDYSCGIAFKTSKYANACSYVITSADVGNRLENERRKLRGGQYELFL